mmetsp:Transcript_23563/g.79574  ORF Transcript_23563/g.79574 Transcript_23563/m.79574 type:complete len:281 (-) Transcript_23563:265-1107(-)
MLWSVSSPRPRRSRRAACLASRLSLAPRRSASPRGSGSSGCSSGGEPAASGLPAGNSACLRNSATKKPPVSWSYGSRREHRASWAAMEPSAGGQSVSTACGMAARRAESKSTCHRSSTPSSSSSSLSPLMRSTCSPTSHVARPARRFIFGSTSSGQASTSTAPGFAAFARLRSAATTASSSTGFNEHVEYAMSPPGRRTSRARQATASCTACSWCATAGVQRGSTEASLRTVPSPLHGTSARTRSNPGASPLRKGLVGGGKRSPRWHVTKRRPRSAGGRP